LWLDEEPLEPVAPDVPADELVELAAGAVVVDWFELDEEPDVAALAIAAPEPARRPAANMAAPSRVIRLPTLLTSFRVVWGPPSQPATAVPEISSS
jgi:hypothetical protein